QIDDPLLIWQGKEEFIDVRDCARAAVCALAAERPQLGVYNVVHPQQWSLDAIVETGGAIHGPLTVAQDRTVATGFAGLPHVRPAGSSVSAARDELAFTAQHDLADSLAYWWNA